MANIQSLLDRNKKWANTQKEQNPELFERLSKGQEPNVLWIGCSDSRVPANQIMDLPPGELFVHRNIANMVVHSDLNLLSVLQYAVEALEVEHVVVCGHYGCGGVKAALGNQQLGLIDNWLEYIRDVARLHSDQLQDLSFDKKHDLLCELNVQEQVKNISETNIVKNAWKQRGNLTIHGWIYNLENGQLKDLDVSVQSAG